MSKPQIELFAKNFAKQNDITNISSIPEITEADRKQFIKDFPKARKGRSGLSEQEQIDALERAIEDYIKSKGRNKAKGDAWELGFRAGFLNSGSSSSINSKKSDTSLGSSQELNITVEPNEDFNSLLNKAKAKLEEYFSKTEAENLYKSIEGLGIVAGRDMRAKLDQLVQDALGEDLKQHLGDVTFTIGGMGGSLSFGDQLIEVSSAIPAVAKRLKKEIGGGKAIFDQNIGQDVAQIQIENKNTNPYFYKAKTDFEKFAFKWHHFSSDDEGFYNSLGIGAVSYRSYLRNSGFWRRSGADKNFAENAKNFLNAYPYQLGSICLTKGNMDSMLRKTGVSVAGAMTKNYTNAQQQRLKQLKIDVNRRYTVWMNSTGKFSNESKIESDINTYKITTIVGAANKTNPDVTGSNYQVTTLAESFKSTAVALVDTTGQGNEILLQAVFDKDYEEAVKQGLKSFDKLDDNIPLPAMSVEVFMGSN